MQNIPLAKLKEIADKTSGIISALNSAVVWAESFESNNQQLAFDLKKYRRKLNKIQHVITEKPVIAFFGASQVGKSYMVNSLLCDDSKKLYLIDHRNPGLKVDFIREINPEGHGNESTSVVTRFSTGKQDSQKPPVKIKLLSAKDLICILCDSYYSDVKDKLGVDYEKRTEQLKAHLRYLDSLMSPQQHRLFTDDDVYDIQEYIEVNFKHRGSDAIELFNKLNFWHEIAHKIAYIAAEKWHEVFSVLWNNHAYISNLFKNLIAELQRVSFSRVVYADFTAVRRSEGAILDVKTLDGLFQQSQNYEVLIATDKDEVVSMKNSFLCALCAEVVFAISGEYSQEDKIKITQNIDVLDFPGARTRLELQEASIGDINVKEMVLRGKVSYLFNSYSSNYEINNLFVCMRTSQTNVRGVPSLVKSWIDHNVGETAEERYKTLEQAQVPPLFVIFTWWNTLLGFSSSTDTADPKERAEKWLKTRFKEEIIADYNWHTDWIKNNGQGQRFDNYFLLRDFIKSYEINKIFDRKYLSENQSEYEEVLSSDKAQNNFLEEFGQFFKESDLVKSFFKDPQLNWEEASVPNKDGTDLILKNILKVANNVTRTNRYINQLANWTKEVAAILAHYHHSDNADEEIIKAARDVAEIHGYMNKIFGLDAYHFGDFVEKLIITEEEIKILYHSKLTDSSIVQETSPAEWIHFIEYSPRLSESNSYEENVKVLQEDYYLDAALPIKEIESYFLSKFNIDIKKMLSLWNTQRDKSAILADAAAELWMTSKLNVANFDYYVDLGFDKAALGKLFGNIQTSFKRLKLAELIAEKIAYFVNRLKTLYEAEDMIAHITAGLINNFIHSLGWDYYKESEIKALELVNVQNNLRMAIPTEKELFEALDNQSIEKLFEFMSNLNENLRKVPLDETVIHKIPMINNYKRWREMIKITYIANCNIPTYDVDANRQVGEILRYINLVDFRLT